MVSGMLAQVADQSYIRPLLNLNLIIPLVVALLAIASCSVYLLTKHSNTQRHARATYVTIQSLHIYPLKSAAGISLQTAEVTRLGFQYDRQWMIVNPANGKMRTAREYPMLVTIQPAFESDDQATQYLRLSLQTATSATHSMRFPIVADGTERTVTVWGQPLLATTYADSQIDRWLGDYLKTPCQLVTIANADIDTFERAVDAKWIEANTNQAAVQQINSLRATAAYADGYPLHVTTTTSLRELNRLIAADGDRDVIEMQRFRPNIVVQGDDDELQAWEEDDWEVLTTDCNVDAASPHTYSDSALNFHMPKPCGRCSIPTVHPQTGQRSQQPTKSLRKHRYNAAKGDVIFGQNACQNQTGQLHVGQQLRIIRRTKPLVYPKSGQVTK